MYDRTIHTTANKGEYFMRSSSVKLSSSLVRLGSSSIILTGHSGYAKKRPTSDKL